MKMNKLKKLITFLIFLNDKILIKNEVKKYGS